MKLLGAVSLAALTTFSAFGKKGDRKDPINLVMVPSTDAEKLASNMDVLAKCLSKKTGLYFNVSVPNNYIVAVEGLGTKKVDLAFLTTFSYLLANKKYGAEAFLTVKRYGEVRYRGQILVRKDSGIKKITDLNGKKFAFTDPASTSGFVLPSILLKQNKVKIGKEVHAGKHDSVVTMVYQGTVDAGATYWSPQRPDGSLGDARRRVLKQFPDVAEKVKILDFTEWIYNDPIVVGKHVKNLNVGQSKKCKSAKGKVPASCNFTAVVGKGLEKCVRANKEIFKAINSADDVIPSSPDKYVDFAKMLDKAGFDIEKLIK